MSIRQTGTLAAVAFALALFGIVVAIHLLSADAAAYSAAARYAQDPTQGGGGGRFFTGSPVDGYTCDVCHEGGDAVEIVIDGLPRDGYEPGTTYELVLGWQTEEMFTLVAEVMADDGTPAGALALPEDPPASALCVSGVSATELIEEPAGARRIATLGECGASSMVLRWTAPDDLGKCNTDAVLYVAGVHGDGTDSPEGDGVTSLRKRIPSALEPGACDDDGAGCSVESRAIDQCIPFLVAVLAIGVHRRRSRP
jgi:hypothetical protein